MKKYKALFFDLDDTLFDSYNQCIKPASQEAIKAMIKLGLKCSMKEALAERADYVRTNKSEKVFAHLSRLYAPKPKQKIIAKAGYTIFYRRKKLGQLELFSGVRPMLATLKTEYLLFLITQGSMDTQKLKVETLGIRSFFQHIEYPDPTKDETKKQSFRRLMAKMSLNPNHVLCIGNRLDNEITFGKQLGCDTCWVKWGEHSLLIPTNESEVPDFTLHRIEDLIRICHL